MFIDKLSEISVPQKSIQGTPWYNILSNPTYVQRFCYLGPHVRNREKYLKDRDDDAGNNFLQSDVVLILMNLSAIPDEVASKLVESGGFDE